MNNKMTGTYSNLISIENLFQAWEEFKKGKRKKHDVMVFERNLEDNLFDLHHKLKTKKYRHGSYQEFYVNDPKRRHIHKAQVQDRIVHHLLYKYLYRLFDRTFVYDSYSCRLNKGTHRAVKRLEKFTKVVSRNYTKDCWALKLDIKKFFASVDHLILKNLIIKKVKDRDILWLISQVIDSFCTCHLGLDPESKKIRILNQDPEKSSGLKVQDDNKKLSQCKGIPLGNLTSQIFANIYLNELDKFIKHKFKVKHYLRYADDFIILDASRNLLCSQINSLIQFLGKELKLELHPNKIILKKLTWGIDFCGYIVLPHYILLRTKTKGRIIKKVLGSNISNQALQSYLGYFSHAKSHKLSQALKNSYFSGAF